MKAAMTLAAIAAMFPEVLAMIPDRTSAPKPAPILTHADEERIKKAEAKRARKAAKRAKKDHQ